MKLKERLEKMLKAKNEQRDKLNARLIESDDKQERAEIGETLKAIAAEIADIEETLKTIDDPADDAQGEAGADNGQRKFNPIAAMETRSGNPNNAREERAKKFAETNRMTLSNEEARAAILVSGGTIAQPTGVSGINGLPPQVSSIVDMVTIVDASGMGGGYTIAYQKTDASAASKTEGDTAATESEPTFEFVKITANDKALVSYISNKVRKQTPLQYEQKVRDSAMTALRKEASKTIISALESSTITQTLDIAVTGSTSKTGVLDEKFLRKLVLSYGGDEAVMGGAVLILNKKDLIALGDIRGTNEKKAVYEITPNAEDPNTGIITDGGLSVRYVINNNCKALSGTTQTSSAIKGIYYGTPRAIELAMFSDYEVATSEDYKFAQDMLAVRGTASMGAALGVYQGFVVAQIPASA